MGVHRGCGGGGAKHAAASKSIVVSEGGRGTVYEDVSGANQQHVTVFFFTCACVLDHTPCLFLRPLNENDVSRFRFLFPHLRLTPTAETLPCVPMACI